MPVQLDLKDRKILYELDLDSRRSASQIAKKVGLSKEVVSYRINNLIKSGVINYFYTVLNTLALGYSHYKIYFKLQNIDPKKEKELIEYFIKNKNCIWLATCRGNWDLAVSLLARNPSDFGQLYQKIINDYGQNILEKNILIIENAPTFNRSYLKEKTEPTELKYKQINQIFKLDETDQKILSILSINSRINIIKMMDKLELTRDIASYRIKKMQREGIIQGFRTSFNLEKLDYSYYKVLFTFKNLSEEREKELISLCKYNKNIVQYIKLIGNWDAEIEFEVENDTQLHDLLLDIRNKFSDIIRNTEQLLVYEKKLNYYPF